MAKREKIPLRPEILSNGDTLKQWLARSRYLLFKHHIKWTEIQKTELHCYLKGIQS
jgi:transposase